MKRIRYEPQEKAAILAAVQDARTGGKTWAETLEVAKQVGYKGTEGALYQLVNSNKPAKKAKAVKQAKAKATPTIAAPVAEQAVTPDVAPTAPVVADPAVKSVVKRAAKPPVVKAPAATPPSGPLDITALVHKVVTDAVVSALEGLLASLKHGK